MYLLNGLKLGQRTLIDGAWYDLTWFAQASPEQLTALGVSYAVDPATPDPALYTWVENPDGSLTITARTADEIAARLASDKTAVCINIDADVDAIYRDAVGNRTSEYQLAEDQSNAYKAAGYTGTVPEIVQKWADLNTQTAQWAADNILAQAAALLSAQLSIRDQRLTFKAQARAAADSAALDTVVINWQAFVVQMRTALGLPV